MGALIFLLLLLVSFASVARDTTDLPALLSIKAHLHHSNSLSSWNSDNRSIHFCKWLGVTCGHPAGRVTALDLDNLGLSGSLSSDIGNLTFLRRLNLSRNHLQGQLPTQVGHLRRLDSLVLSKNSLKGTIPASLANCSNLRHLSLSRNSLVGQIPAELGGLRKLEFLSLHDNHLTGEIPASLGNLSSLTKIDLVGNQLGGAIPPSLGRLHDLVHISLTGNRLVGQISSIFNLSSLSFLYLGSNMFSGALLPDMGNRLPKIEILQAFSNHFDGPIPMSLPNASGLRQIVLTDNNLSGSLPRDIGKLRNLSSLSLRDNRLEANYKEAEDWEFLTSLSNCSNLRTLDLSNNKLEGVLPSSVANLSTQLRWLGFGGNEVQGSIPAGIGRFVHLHRLYMDRMLLTGTVPSTVGKLRMLHFLVLNVNRLSGILPSSIGNLTQLENLYFNDNNLQGGIPGSIGNLQNLVLCDLSFNEFNGSIPKELADLASLTQHLNLSHNFLMGTLPPEVGSLKNLAALDISENRLSGELPSSLGDCQVLQYLYMQGNQFEGTIPDSLSSLSGILVLDLSRNNLSGSIPQSFDSFIHMQLLNLSFNDLEGPVPGEGVFENATLISVIGNSKLCGGIKELGLQPCLGKKNESSAAARVLIPIGILVPLLLVSLTVACYLLHRSRTRKYMPVNHSESQYPMASYAELLTATNGFSSFNLIGEGSFSHVYKGTMGYPPKDVAVKVLKSEHPRALQSFKAECETLARIKHRNLIKILNTCSGVDRNGTDFLAIVTEYIPNGSLDEWLHAGADEDGAPRSLSLLQRLNIAIDVASALDYLHHYAGTPVVHCDLKPSNVLVGDDMVARLCDFGSAEFVNGTPGSDSSEEARHGSGLKGSIGYVPPEYGMGRRVSTKGDVYSYGVLLLVLFSGRRPTDARFKDGESLRSYVQMAYPAHVMDVVDPLLLDCIGEEKTHKCLALVLDLGLSCSKELATERRDMGDVIARLLFLRKMLLEEA